MLLTAGREDRKKHQFLKKKNPQKQKQNKFQFQNPILLLKQVHRREQNETQKVTRALSLCPSIAEMPPSYLQGA